MSSLFYTAFPPSSNTPIFKVHRVDFTDVYENHSSRTRPNFRNYVQMPGGHEAHANDGTRFPLPVGAVRKPPSPLWMTSGDRLARPIEALLIETVECREARTTMPIHDSPFRT